MFEFLKKKEEVGYFFKRIYLRIKTEVFITLYFDLIKTQIKTMMAKQLDSFEKAQKASRLKRLHNRDGQIWPEKVYCNIYMLLQNLSGSSASYLITFKQRVFNTLWNTLSSPECGLFAFDSIRLIWLHNTSKYFFHF